MTKEFEMKVVKKVFGKEIGVDVSKWWVKDKLHLYTRAGAKVVVREKAPYESLEQ